MWGHSPLSCWPARWRMGSCVKDRWHKVTYRLEKKGHWFPTMVFRKKHDPKDSWGLAHCGGDWISDLQNSKVMVGIHPFSQFASAWIHVLHLQKDGSSSPMHPAPTGLWSEDFSFYLHTLRGSSDSILVIGSKNTSLPYLPTPSCHTSAHNIPLCIFYWNHPGQICFPEGPNWIALFP